ncbi:MAG: hypothetical protein ACK41E_11780 [Deinococcales bacterium]
MKASLWIFALLLIVAGLNHFWNPKFYLQIMPPYLPYRLELVYISGVLEVLGGALLLFAKTRELGVWLSIATLVLVYPANVHMALNSGAYSNIPAWILWVRLPLQALLIWWAYSLRLS